MNTVKVRDIEIGAGAPKIIVPIVGKTKEEILTTAKSFHSIPMDVWNGGQIGLMVYLILTW